MKTEMPLKGKTAIITGGCQGIGKCISLRLIEAGMQVIAADIDEEAGAEIETDYSNTGIIKYIKTDVSDEKSVYDMVNETQNIFGRIDLIVNNAGIGISKPVTDLLLEEWDKVLNTNLRSIFLTVKYGLHALKKVNGNIINIASTRAFMSEANTEAYSASKGGVVAITHALAVSCGPDVRVNCISPGWIEIGAWQKKNKHIKAAHSVRDKLQHPAGRVGMPDDIASMVYYLVSTESTFITGQNFVIDGGMTKKMIYEP